MPNREAREGRPPEVVASQPSPTHFCVPRDDDEKGGAQGMSKKRLKCQQPLRRRKPADYDPL
ncbi:MAG: hypothetical protein ABFC77_04590 [Thermoguttaceae bacterium]